MALFQPLCTLKVSFLLRFLAFRRPIVLRHRRAVLLVHHAVDEARREKSVGAVHQRCFLFAIGVSPCRTGSTRSRICRLCIFLLH